MVAIKGQRSLDIVSVKKEAKLSASEIPGVEEGKSDGDLRCRSLLTVCQSCLGLPRDEETTIQLLSAKGAEQLPLSAHVYCGHGRSSQLLLSCCKKRNMAEGRHFEKPLNDHKSAMFYQIHMKFDTIKHFNSYTYTYTRLKFYFSKNPTWQTAYARACPRYSKRPSEVQNRHDANNCRLGAYWRHLGNTIEPSVCDGDAALCQLNYFDHLLSLGTPLPTRSRLLTSDHSVSLSFRSFVPLVSRFL